MSESDLRALAHAAGVSPAEIAPHAPLLAAVREAARQGAMEGRRIVAGGLVTAAEVKDRLRIGDDKLAALRRAGELAMFRLPGSREWYITEAALQRAVDRWEREGIKPESRYRRRAA